MRPARPDDAEGIARAARDLGGQYAAFEPERFHVPERQAQLDWLTAMLESPPAANAAWLVAEVEGEVVGDAYAQLHEPLGNAAVQPQLDVGRRRAHLDYLAVQERYRGRGVGGSLLQAVEDWARENGAELMFAETNIRSNVGAVEFYERHGYARQAVVLRKSL